MFVAAVEENMLNCVNYVASVLIFLLAMRDICGAAAASNSRFLFIIDSFGSCCIMSSYTDGL